MPSGRLLPQPAIRAWWKAVWASTEDVDGTILDDWAAAGCEGEIVRPDAYRFARVPSAEALPGLVDALLDRLLVGVHR